MKGFLQGAGVAVLFFSCAAWLAPRAEAQVLRRDPAVQPEDLDIDGRRYKPYGQVKLWLFRFHPFASLEATWDDNIFLAPPYQQEDDFVFDTVLGARTDWRHGRHETLLGYQMKYRSYARHPEESTLEHRASVSSHWNFDWFFFDAGDEFKHIKDPEPDAFDLLTERSENDAWVRGGLYQERIGIELAYRMRWFDFVSRNLGTLDHNEHFATLGAYYLLREDSRVSQDLYAFLEFRYGAFRFRERYFSDSNQLAGTIGAKGTLFDKFAFSMKVGYIGLDPVGNGVPGSWDTDGFRGPTYEASVVMLITEWQKARIAAFRRLQYSLGSNFRVFDRLEGSYEHRFDNHVIQDLYVRPHVFLEHADPSDSRSTTRMGTGLRLEYFLKDWFAAGASWEFAMRTGRRDPALPSLNYRNHRIMFHVTLYL